MNDIDALFDSLAVPNQLTPASRPGIYILCVSNPDTLPGITAGRQRLIYVGMTKQGLDLRDHFKATHSGFSTLRRSLGALLKRELGLSAIPRSSGPSRSNALNYRFAGNGESQISAWMHTNLVVAYEIMERGIVAREKELIGLLEPPLNLTDWPKPQRQHVKELRAACVREASV